MEQKLEKQLVSRLKILGCMLLFFALIALFYNVIPNFADEVDTLDEEIAEELQEDPAPLNPFFVSSIFSVVGCGLLLISWKKKKSLFSSSLEKRDSE